MASEMPIASNNLTDAIGPNQIYGFAIGIKETLLGCRPAMSYASILM